MDVADYSPQRRSMALTSWPWFDGDVQNRVDDDVPHAVRARHVATAHNVRSRDAVAAFALFVWGSAHV